MSQSAKNFYKIFVGNLPWTVGNYDLKYYFSKFGYVDSANVIFDKSIGVSKGYGFVAFGTRDAYNSAVNKNHFLDGRVLKIEPAGNKK